MTLDRIITIELPAAGRDSSGGRVAGPPQQSIELWAARDDREARRAMMSGREDTALQTTWTIHWREGLDNRWHIVHRGQRYRILGVKERGRQQYLDVLAEAIQ